MYVVYRSLFSMDVIGAIELNADGNSKKRRATVWNGSLHYNSSSGMNPETAITSFPYTEDTLYWIVNAQYPSTGYTQCLCVTPFETSSFAMSTTVSDNVHTLSCSFSIDRLEQGLTLHFTTNHSYGGIIWVRVLTVFS